MSSAGHFHSGLAFAQQRKIENQLKEPVGRPGISFWRILFYGGLSAAAACFILAMFLPALSKSKPKVQHLALNSPPISQTKPQAPIPEKKPPVVIPASSSTVAPAIIPALRPAPTEQKPQPSVQEKQAPVDMVVQSAPPAPPVQPAPAVVLTDGAGRMEILRSQVTALAGRIERLQTTLTRK